MSIIRRWLVLVVALWLACPAAAADIRVGLREFERLRLDLDAAVDATGQADFTIEGFGGRWRLTLAPNATLLGALEPRARQVVEGRDNLFLAGRLHEVAGSWARLSRVGGRWSGGFSDGRELYLVDRAAGLELPQGRYAAEDELLLYRLSDLELAPILLHDPLPVLKDRPSTVDLPRFLAHLQELTVLNGAAPFLMPVTVVTDTQFNSAFGANAAAVVAARTNFIDGLYSSQLGTGIQLFHYQPLVADGPLVASDAVELLTQFRSFMSSGAGSGIPFVGLAHLFTARARDGGIAGIAYLGVLCNRSLGYGVDWNLSNETTNGLVFAHEVGHNFNAPHDGEDECLNEPFRGIMNPSINGSQQFSDCSLQQMAAAVATASCLVPNPLGEGIFADGFEVD